MTKFVNFFSSEAKGYYKKINATENNSEFLFKIGQLYFRIINYNEAKRFLEKIIREDSGGIFVAYPVSRANHEVCTLLSLIYAAYPGY